MAYIQDPSTGQIVEVVDNAQITVPYVKGSEGDTSPHSVPAPEPVPESTPSPEPVYILNPDTQEIVEVVPDAKIPENITVTKGTNAEKVGTKEAIPVATQAEINAGQKILDKMVEEGKKKIEAEKKQKEEAEANWKPDFTKPNPYEGAPESYIKKVKEEFKPTVEKPIPPFTGEVVDAEKNLILNDYGQVVTGEEYNAQLPTINARAQAFTDALMAKDNVQLSDGQWMPKESFNDLPENYQKIAKEQGYDALKTAIDNDRKKYENAAAKLNDYEVMAPLPKGMAGPPTPVGTDIAKYLRNNPGDEQTLLDAGFSKEDIDEAKDYNNRDMGLAEFKNQYFKDKNLDVKLPAFNDPDYDKKMDAVLKANDDATEKWKAKYGKSEKDIVKEAGISVAEFVVPGVYVARNWNKLSGGEKALNIALDVLSVVPAAGAVVKGAATGAKTVSTAGRTARLVAGVKGAGQAVATEVRAPIDMIIHPIETAKSSVKSVRSLAENVLHPKKIPEAVITTSEGTVRLRVTEATTAKEAKAIRDSLTDLAAKGEKPVVEVNGVKYELSQSPLMKETGGGLAHATPMGEAFESGIEVAAKPGMPAREQGLFVAPEPLPKFTQSSAFGKTGEKPAIIITSTETAKKAVPSGKIYRGTAEMELKYPVGIKIPEPKQKLFTRIGQESTKVEIWLEKPLSKTQIAKLKVAGLIEDIKAPFKPALTISKDGKALSSKQINKLAGIIDDTDRDTARALREASRRVSSAGIARTGSIARTVASRGAEVSGRASAVRTESPRASAVSARESRVGTGRAEGKRATTRVPTSERTGTRAIERTPDEIRQPGRTGTERIPEGRVTVPGRVPVDSTERITPDRIIPPDERTPAPSPPTRTPPDERINPPPKRPPETPKRPPNKYDNMTDTQKRRAIDDANGDAIAWRQGELNGKDVWHVIVTPFEQDNYLTILGRKPGRATLVRGPGSAVKTAQLLYGKELSKPLTIDIGAFDAHLEPISGNKGIALTYKPDPHLSTTSDITISKKPGNISNNGKTFPLRDKK